MVVITIIGVAMNILLGYFGARITTNIVRDIRDDLFEKIQTFSHSEYESIGVSSLITRTTNDAYQIALFMGNIFTSWLYDASDVYCQSLHGDADESVVRNVRFRCLAFSTASRCRDCSFVRTVI